MLSQAPPDRGWPPESGVNEGLTVARRLRTIARRRDERGVFRPILNSLHEAPQRHGKLGTEGLPTDEIIESRRKAEFLSPVPPPKVPRGKGTQLKLALGKRTLSTAEQQYNPHSIVNGIRLEVDRWRRLPEAR